MLVLKKICLGFLIVFLLFITYAVHAGVAVVNVKTPDTRLWIPIPIALAQLAGNFIKVPLSKQEEFRQLLRYREPLKESLSQLLEMPDADLVEVRKADGHVLIYKRGNYLLVDAYDRGEQVKVRASIKSLQRLLEDLSKPSSDVGDVIAILALQPPGDLVYVKTKKEEVRISLW
jgi:hypothetical protein